MRAPGRHKKDEETQTSSKPVERPTPPDLASLEYLFVRVKRHPGFQFIRPESHNLQPRHSQKDDNKSKSATHPQGAVLTRSDRRNDHPRASITDEKNNLRIASPKVVAMLLGNNLCTECRRKLRERNQDATRISSHLGKTARARARAYGGGEPVCFFRLRPNG